MSDFEELLKISSDYQEFCHPNDYLSDIIEENELSLSELDCISAAKAVRPPKFSSLINKTPFKKG